MIYFELLGEGFEIDPTQPNLISACPINMCKKYSTALQCFSTAGHDYIAYYKDPDFLIDCNKKAPDAIVEVDGCIIDIMSKKCKLEREIKRIQETTKHNLDILEGLLEELITYNEILEEVL